MDKERFKDMLISILIGACVAFLTTLIEGARDALNGYMPETAGGLTASLKYMLRHMV